jgi:hypothetical protein
MIIYKSNTGRSIDQLSFRVQWLREFSWNMRVP